MTTKSEDVKPKFEGLCRVIVWRRWGNETEAHAYLTCTTSAPASGHAICNFSTLGDVNSWTDGGRRCKQCARVLLAALITSGFSIATLVQEG